MKYVEWIEPFNSEASITCICRISVEDAIKHYKALGEAKGKYLTDEQALDSFIVCHWASVVEYE